MDDMTAPGPPAGWLLDTTTGQTRWWDGSRWTEHVKPEGPTTRASLRAAAAAQASAPEPEPVPMTFQPSVEPPRPGPIYNPYAYAAAVPLTSKNGYAKAALVLVLLLVLGVGIIPVLISGGDPTVVLFVSLANIVMVLAALVLSIVGLVVAVRRPTKKKESIFGLVASIVLILFAVARVAFAFLAAPVIDVPALETQISDWASTGTDEEFDTICPSTPPTETGDTFTCAATGAAGTVLTVEVTNDPDDMLSWRAVE